MTTTLSSRGQIVLPKQTRLRLGLRAGAKFVCRVEGGSIVLTPEHRPTGQHQRKRDKKTGLLITQTPPEVVVTAEQVKAALADFP